MRCLQALGSSAVMSIGAATLADIYEPAREGHDDGYILQCSAVRSFTWADPRRSANGRFRLACDLLIGLVLLAFGVGSLLGSMLGGRYSDHVFSQLKAKNGGQSHPEMRLQSTMLAMIFCLRSL
ncbi:hypothetical protein A0H81_08578 [Grifola frondosa]|uniref:Uncharacterized protein n=1 Tax=Grifola frondosa TaxID=5627 RepID=A0A1C7M4M3_GRIFR|nr:hypothetical protein A0H81_08578 [Grifola frondosa]